MNIEKIIASIFVIVLLGAGVLYGLKMNTDTSKQEEIIVEQTEDSEKVEDPNEEISGNSIYTDTVISDITKNVWLWDSTITGNPNRPDDIIYPNKPNVFTIKFYKDKTLSGTTDCNNFSGTYSVDEFGQIDIGPLMSTLMYCEGSQEQDFLGSISDGKITLYDTSFQLYGSSKKTVYFVQGEELK